MEKRELFMPFKIMVAQVNDFTAENGGTTRYYSIDGKPFYSMRIKSANSTAAVEFDENLYCDLISILKKEDAKSFIVNHPRLRFVFYGRPNSVGLTIEEFETLDRYCEILVNAVQQYNDIRSFILLRQKSENHPTPEDRSEMLQIYRKYFYALGFKTSSWSSLSEMEEYYYDVYNVVESVDEKYQETDPRESYQDLLEDYFDGNEAQYHEHLEAVTEHANAAVDARMYEDISRYIDGIIGEARAVYDTADMSLHYQCTDLLTAMYMMTFVSMHNHSEYKLCANPKCHQYFKVNPSHPQTLCPIHMAPRQRKRRNQRKYRDDYYAKQRGDESSNTY